MLDAHAGAEGLAQPVLQVEDVGVHTALVLRKLGADSAVFLGTAALAELGKLVLTGLLCAAVFIWVKPLAPGFFFLGMIVVLAANWVGLARSFPA